MAENSQLLVGSYVDCCGFMGALHTVFRSHSNF